MSSSFNSPNIPGDSLQKLIQVTDFLASKIKIIFFI